KGHPSGWPFCIGAEKMPDATLRVLYSHICQIQQRMRLPQLAYFHTCPPYQNLSLSSSITIFLLTKFMVNVA
ncbi:TPA: hypothetical protein ACGH74_003392, partial [Shigella flexneri]